MALSRVAPIGRRIAGTETGVLLGYLAQRVLGQYDLLVVDDDDSAVDAVYYVGGNILALEKRFAFRPRDFRLWIAIHECTHRAQFTGVPWLKPYYLSLVDALALVDRPGSAPSRRRRSRAPPTSCATAATRSTTAGWSRSWRPRNSGARSQACRR